MAAHLPIRQTEVIVLSDSDADSETNTDTDDDLPISRGGGLPGRHPITEIIVEDTADDNEWPSALEAIDDAQFEAVQPASTNFVQPAPSPSHDPPEIFTEDDCLQKVLDIFPDIAHGHVIRLFREGTHDGVSNTVWCDQLIVQLLDSGPYPKEREARKSLKRKRSNSNDEVAIKRYEKMERENAGHSYSQLALKLLQNEFLDIPVKHIQVTLRTNGTLFKACSILYGQQHDYSTLKSNPFSKVRPRVITKQNDAVGDPTMDYVRADLLKELSAAKKKRQKDEAKLREEEREKLEVKRARDNGTLVECSCCYDEFPPNRMTECDAEIPHLFCCACARKYVEDLVGSAKCRPKCISMDACGSGFARQQLRIFLDQGLFDRLERMQQQEDIDSAGIENLEECPFCDFRAECPPVEIDREFRCRNLDCEKVSCRLCQAETHIPQTCEEFAKDNKLSVRHTVEEAMTNALKRTCNKCKQPFIKLEGCNKIMCNKCRNLQCYVCSKDITNYNHFKDTGPCTLYDPKGLDLRHDEEVKKAEAEAHAKVRAENPDLTEDDLKIKVSERVKREEDALIQRAKAAQAAGRPVGAPGFHAQMHQREGLLAEFGMEAPPFMHAQFGPPHAFLQAPRVFAAPHAPQIAPQVAPQFLHGLAFVPQWGNARLGYEQPPAEVAQQVLVLPAQAAPAPVNQPVNPFGHLPQAHQHAEALHAEALRRQNEAAVMMNIRRAHQNVETPRRQGDAADMARLRAAAYEGRRLEIPRRRR